MTARVDGLILPAIVKEGIPVTVDIVLNCQLLTLFWPVGVGLGLGVGVGVRPEVGSWGFPPPHPPSRTTSESKGMTVDNFVPSFTVLPPIYLGRVASPAASQKMRP